MLNPFTSGAPRARLYRSLVFAAALVALVVGARPVRKARSGEWCARPGAITVPGWIPRWRAGEVREPGAPTIVQWPGMQSREGISIGLRFVAVLHPSHGVRLAAGGNFEAGFAARYLAPLAAQWGDLDAVAIMDRGPEPLQAALLDALGRDGIAVEKPSLQLVAPQSFAERYGRDKVAGLSRRPPARLLWIGYDGADWGIIRPLLAAGRLPNFKRLLEGAAYGRMRPFSPMMSPLLWTSMATGKTPAEHNITDFVVQLPDGKIKAIGSNFRTVKALWEIAPLAGRNTAFIDWWASYPADESERGVIISNAVRNLAHAPRAPEKSGATYPDDYLVKYFPRIHANYTASAAELRGLVATTDAELAEEEQRQSGKQPKEGKKVVQQEGLLVLRDAFAQGRGNTGEAVFLMRNLQPDLTAVYYEGIDMVGHRYQHCMAPALDTCPPEDRVRFGHIVEAYYEYQDRLLGQLLAAQQGPYYTLLVSDHGFHHGAERPEKLLPYTDENPVGWHHEEALFVLKGPGIQPGELPVAISIYDIMPTVLYLMGMPVAQDFKGQVARSAFTPAFMHANPIRAVRTFEELGPPRKITHGAVNPDVEKELLANLARLGYISPTSTTSTTSTPGESAPAGQADQESITSGARITKAKFLIAAGDYAGALEELNLVPADKVKGRTISYKVKALDALGRKAEAAEVLRTALKAKEAEEESLLWLVQLDLSMDRPDAAEADLKAYGNEANAPSVYRTSQGLILARRGNAAGARAMFWAVLREDPLQTSAAEQLHAALTPREMPEFERLLRAGLAKDSQIGMYHYMLAGIELRTGRTAAGIESLRRAVDAEPTIDQYALDYAAALFQLRRLPEAENVLLTQTGRHPNNPDAWEALGNLRGARGDLAGAADAFGKAVAAGGSGARLYAGLAATLARTGRPAEARKALAAGLGKHPGDPALLSVQRQLGGG